MAIGRQNNQEDLNDYALLTSVTEAIASQRVFRNHSVTINTLVTALTSLEVHEPDDNRSFGRRLGILVLASAIFPANINKILECQEAIKDPSNLAEFDFARESQPYFNYLKIFLGKADWQSRAAKPIATEVLPENLVPSYIPNLPNELWVQIASHLSFQERINFRYVNHTFNIIVEHLPITESTIQTSAFTFAINLPALNEKETNRLTSTEFLASLSALSADQLDEIKKNIFYHSNSVRTSLGIFHLPEDSLKIIISNNIILSITLASSFLLGSLFSVTLGLTCGIAYSLYALGIVATLAISTAPIVFFLLGFIALSIVASAAMLITLIIKHEALVTEINIAIEKNKTAHIPYARFFNRVDLQAKKIAEKKEVLAAEEELDPSLKHAGMTSLKHAGMTDLEHTRMAGSKAVGMTYSEHAESTAGEIRHNTPVLKTLTTEGDMIAVSDDEESIATNGYRLM